MAFHDNADTLFAELQDICDKVLERWVAPVAKDILRSHIVTDIYNAYTRIPNGWVTRNADGSLTRTTYQRRYSLLDEGENGLFAKLENPGELLITSNAKPMPPIYGSKNYPDRIGSLLKLLSSKDMGAWAHGFSRPALNNAQLDINQNKRIRDAIQYGLESYTR